MKAIGLALVCGGLATPAMAQQSVSVPLTNVRIQNGLNQSRSSAPNTISPAFRYHYDIDAMVRGQGGVLGTLYPSPTPLATVMEDLSPGSSEALEGVVDNCTGTHPVGLSGLQTSGSTLLLGVNVNYAMTLSVGIDASNHAYFTLTNVVLTPSLLVGSLLFTSGEAVITRIDFCPANCDESTAQPVLNVADFSCFLAKFAAGEPRANCDCSTSEPVLNVADFSCFLAKFAAGCP
jgi:hypothetical protein